MNEHIDPDFGDAFLENLPVLGFFVVEQRVHVDGLVVLAHAGINSDLAEQSFHAERAGLIGDDGHDQLAQFGIAQQLRQQPHKHHGRRNFASVRAFVKFLEVRIGNGFQRRRPALCAWACIRQAAGGAPAYI